MIALLIDLYGIVTPLCLTANNTDDAIREIVQTHRNVLVQCGLTDEWINENVYKVLTDEDPEWRENVREYFWYARHPEYDSYDQMAAPLIVDPARAKTSHTGLLVGTSGENVVFAYDEAGPESLRLAAYAALRQGRAIFIENTQEAFSDEWIDANKEKTPPLLSVMPGLRYGELHSDRGDEDFGTLRLYIFDNRQPATP